MNKLTFHPGDFKPILDLFDRNQVVAPEYKAAEIAQAILDEWLKSATVVYAEGDNQPWHNVSFQGATHKALVIGIEPIKPKCEKHEPMLKTFDFACWQHGVCRNCGASIEPTGWKEKTV